MSDRRVARGAFVTSPGTGCGKTTLACRLLAALEDAGWRVRVRKPVESGCRATPAGATDAARLSAASARRPPPETVCQYRLAAVASAARAAELERADFGAADLARACGGTDISRACGATNIARAGDATPDDGEFLLVEGAGGFYSPLARGMLNADLAAELGLPLLVVVADRLGCIGETLLLLEAAARRGLEVRAVVLNPLAPERPDDDTDNLRELAAWAGAPQFAAAFGRGGASAGAPASAAAFERNGERGHAPVFAAAFERGGEDNRALARRLAELFAPGGAVRSAAK